ncbi:hypothetical protein ACWT_0980 [Actinoplanes sp. SE50]|nr:hypothetical protein ACPL_1098 [Actinoplanes sp. SE50/110]ATO80395.1 hypothetical protein ACWT_0980 [Actinoplanes sp. SE50]SLL97802.1 hypothetical protein ACSP50_1012 [Actinoplanes sp. SE50/110]
MIRYKYGPWDNRYYPVIGALVGKGLLAYTRGGKGSVALRPTAMGRKIVSELQGAPAWMETAERCEAVAEHVGKLSGNGLKELIYEKLPEILDRPHRELIRP